MNLPTLAEIEAAAQIVYRAMPPTPQYRWPLLCEHVGTRTAVDRNRSVGRAVRAAVGQRNGLRLRSE